MDGSGKITSFTVVQSGAKPGAGELRTHRLAIGVYDFDDSGRLARQHRVELDVTGERVDVPELVGVPRGKLVLVNDDDLTYCTMRLDTGSLTTLVDRIADITEPLPRTLCWSAAWEMTREAELKARDFVRLRLLQQKPPDIETTVSPELRKELEERLRDDVRALRTFVDGDFDGWGIA